MNTQNNRRLTTDVICYLSSVALGKATGVVLCFVWSVLGC